MGGGAHTSGSPMQMASPDVDAAGGGASPSTLPPPRVVNLVQRHTVFASEWTPGMPLRDLNVNHCNDAHLYLLEPCRFATVLGCSDCTIVIGSVQSVLRVIGCERIQLVSGKRGGHQHRAAPRVPSRPSLQRTRFLLTHHAYT